MNDNEPSRRPFQFSLWSLFVLTTLVAIVCSIGVTTDRAVLIVNVAGAAICFVGFGLLSLRKHPNLNADLVHLTFYIRVVGVIVLGYGLMAFVNCLLRRLR